MQNLKTAIYVTENIIVASYHSYSSATPNTISILLLCIRVKADKYDGLTVKLMMKRLHGIHWLSEILLSSVSLCTVKL